MGQSLSDCSNSSASASIRIISSPTRLMHRHGTKNARSFPKKFHLQSSGMIIVQIFPVCTSTSRSQIHPRRLPSHTLMTSFSCKEENRSHFILFPSLSAHFLLLFYAPRDCIPYLLCMFDRNSFFRQILLTHSRISPTIYITFRNKETIYCVFRPFLTQEHECRQKSAFCRAYEKKGVLL